MKKVEEIVYLDKKNFDEHLAELEELLGSNITAKRKASFELQWCSSGPTDFRFKPHERTRNNISTNRYLISEFLGKSTNLPFLRDKRPKVFVRTSWGKNSKKPSLIIECIANYQNAMWDNELLKCKDYFSEEKRYYANAVSSCLDRIFFEASDAAYLRFVIKEKNLDKKQLLRLKAIWDNFFSIAYIPEGDYSMNRYEADNLKDVINIITKEKKQIA